MQPSLLTILLTVLSTLSLNKTNFKSKAKEGKLAKESKRCCRKHTKVPQPRSGVQLPAKHCERPFSRCNQFPNQKQYNLRHKCTRVRSSLHHTVKSVVFSRVSA